MDRIVVADDHPLFRAALTSAVARAAPGTSVVECSTLTEAMAALEQAPADLLTLDLRMPDVDAFAGLIRVRNAYVAVPVVVVSASEDPQTIRRAIAYGASGFIPKSADLGQMVEALKAVLDGETWAPAGTTDDAPDTEAEARIASLTPSQLKILSGLRQGRLNKQIAFDLGVTEATIKAHLTGLFRKLGVQNRTQAVIIAQALGAEA